MGFEDLFAHRSLVASKLKDYIRDQGYTKISFARKADISRPTLDKLLNGSIDSKSTFDRHLKKILQMLALSPDDLLLYAGSRRKAVTAVFSENAPEEHLMTRKAVRQRELLLDIVELCATYY